MCVRACCMYVSVCVCVRVCAGMYAGVEEGSKRSIMQKKLDDMTMMITQAGLVFGVGKSLMFVRHENQVLRTCTCAHTLVSLTLPLEHSSIRTPTLTHPRLSHTVPRAQQYEDTYSPAHMYSGSYAPVASKTHLQYTYLCMTYADVC